MSDAKQLMSDLIDARGRVNRAEKDLARAKAALGEALDRLYAATDVLVAALCVEADGAQEAEAGVDPESGSYDEDYDRMAI